MFLPLDGRAAATRPGDDDVVGTFATVIGGERVTLFAERASLAAEQTLFVADVHLGKAAAFRAGGVPLPRGATAADLARLARLCAQTDARRLVILGDFLHAKSGRVAALDAAFCNGARRTMASISCWCAAITTPMPATRRRNGASPVSASRIRSRRFSLATAGAASLRLRAVRTHPSRLPRLRTGRRKRASPCFVLGRRHAILPAFGRLTGLAMVTPAADETIVAIAGSRMFALRFAH
jgi:hypothetical protein